MSSSTSVFGICAARSDRSRPAEVVEEEIRSLTERMTNLFFSFFFFFFVVVALLNVKDRTSGLYGRERV